MSRALSSEEKSRLAARALETLLAITSTTPTRSIGDELRHSIVTTARRVVIDAAIRNDERRRAERRLQVRRAIVAAAVVAAVVVARHRMSQESAE